MVISRKTLDGMYLMVRKIYLLSGNFLLNFRKNYLSNQLSGKSIISGIIYQLSGKIHFFRNTYLLFQENLLIEQMNIYFQEILLNQQTNFLKIGKFLFKTGFFFMFDL